MKKIAIVGSQGIPAKYGGFETMVEFLTKELHEKFEFTVYCSGRVYEAKNKKYNNSKMVYVPLLANGFQSTPYDIISLFHAARNNDIILILGTSGSIILPVFRWFYPNKKLIINVDGLEHKRQKWNKLIRAFLKLNTKLSVKYADVIVSDNKAIKDYLLINYQKNSKLIPYGGDQVTKIPLSPEIRQKLSLPEYYAFNVSRIEPENNTEMILKAFSSLNYPLVFIGNWNHSKYGLRLKRKYSIFKNIRLIDPIYEQYTLDQIRSNCTVYIHGHSAGGTNPSLIEAMNSGLPVFAYDVIYNRETTNNEAFYFRNENDLRTLMDHLEKEPLAKLASRMNEIAKNKYTWKEIARQYARLFSE